MPAASSPKRCRSRWFSGCSFRASTDRCGACRRTARRRIGLERQHEPRRHHGARAVGRHRISRALRAAPAPPPQDRYWRGPVLHDFDGRTWRRSDPAVSAHRCRLEPVGGAYHYTLSLEPHQHHWIFALDWPDAVGPAERVAHERLYVGSARAAYRARIDVIATSLQPRRGAAEPLGRGMRARDTRLPPGRNPRTLELARQLRSAHPDDAGYVRAVLDLFRRQAFLLHADRRRSAQDSVDEFLFDTKRGFCGHYASAFAVADARRGNPDPRRHRLSRRYVTIATPTTGSCARAMRMPGTRSGSTDAAGCASIRPRRSRRSASSTA